MRRYLLASVTAVGLSCSLPLAAQNAPDASASESFRQLLDEHWQHSVDEQIWFRRDPDSFRMDGKLPAFSPEARLRRHQYNQQVLDRLEEIDAAGLNEAERVSLAVFLYERQTEQAAFRQLDRYFPFTNRVSWQSYFVGAPESMSFLTLEDYDNYLVSLADYPRYNAENLALLEQAVDLGYTQYCGSLQGFEQSISDSIVENPEASALYAPFEAMPDTIAATDQARLRKRGKALIADAVMPAFRQFLEFYLEEYSDHCRDKPGVDAIPEGEDYYRYLVEFFTTTDMTPKEVHELGLAEVARIRGEMEAVIEEVGFDGSFADFLTFLRTDPRFYTDTPEDLMEKASRIAKRMDGQLPRLFVTLPRNTYDIKAVPAVVAERTSGAYYVPAPGDGRTPGTYYINTSKLDSRPLYAMEALTFHEAVPGHHLQNALAQEEAIPEFRRYLNHSAFTEGWGLYSERLGLEAGFYTDPYSNFGRLTYEMWRACRLVVDTGIHAYGWSRQKAIDYLADNTALSVHEATAEIDRYITWPGQALGYKIGEIKIRQLRARAEEQLGKDFDLREFHDVVLSNGSVPIAVLEQIVDGWLAEQLTADDD